MSPQGGSATASAPAPWPESLFATLQPAGFSPSIAREPSPGGLDVNAKEGASGPPRRTGALPAAFRYARRSGLVVPDRLRTERMPRDVTGLLDALIRNVRFLPEHLLAVRQESADVERREGDLFDSTAQTRRREQSAINFQFARQNAHELLGASQYIAPKTLGLRLQQALVDALDAAGQPSAERAVLQRALNVILVQSPNMLREALRRAMGAVAEVVDAYDLPDAWESPVALPPSPRNLYGCMPQGLNTWELAFADWLDKEPGVVGWTRNLPRPTAADDWSVRIVLPDSGRGYYPDFVLCVDGRKQPHGVGLAEIKERTESDASGLKSRTEYREYGRALMLSYDRDMDRFIRVEYAPDIGRNREIGTLRSVDLL